MPDHFHLNGTRTPLPENSGRTLLEVLRDDHGLTGCKYGCGEGQCGACTVLIDDAPVRSCQTKCSALADHKVRTVESLEKDDVLHPVQQAFLDADAFQCGYCTCGMILSAVALLESDPQPGEEEILSAMNGNICRCGGYSRIRKAIHRAAELMSK